MISIWNLIVKILNSNLTTNSIFGALFHFFNFATSLSGLRTSLLRNPFSEKLLNSRSRVSPSIHVSHRTPFEHPWRRSVESIDPSFLDPRFRIRGISLRRSKLVFHKPDLNANARRWGSIESGRCTERNLRERGDKAQGKTVHPSREWLPPLPIGTWGARNLSTNTSLYYILSPNVIVR